MFILKIKIILQFASLSSVTYVIGAFSIPIRCSARRLGNDILLANLAEHQHVDELCTLTYFSCSWMSSQKEMQKQQQHQELKSFTAPASTATATIIINNNMVKSI